MKLDWKFHISTDEMTTLDKVASLRSIETKAPELGNCARLTTFYEDRGQLHWKHGRNVQTLCGYFVQSWDREMCFVIEEPELGLCSVKPHLDANIKSEVIKCRVPIDIAWEYEQKERGALVFLSAFHPTHQARVEALSELLGLPHTLERLHQCEHEFQQAH